MPVDLRPRNGRRPIRITRPSKLPYVMAFVLCAVLVIVGTRWSAEDEPAAGPSHADAAP